MLHLLFPPKCVLCQQLLQKEETDFCHSCRENTEIFKKAKNNIPFVAHWTALWYYKNNVRHCIHRFKFGNKRYYANVFGRLLAMKLSNSLAEDADIIGWVPISWLRKRRRGYDQSELVARAVGKELGIPVMPILRKVRHTPPQSGLKDAAQRRANVQGAYKVRNAKRLIKKKILLIDDVATTGATASECAKMLLIAGVNKVDLAVIASASKDK